MLSLPRLLRRLRSALRLRRIDDEVAAELESHIEMETARNVAAGMDPRAAREKATRDFGGVDRYREETRDAHGVRPLEELARDVALAGRALRLRPGFALSVIATMAIGIGANTAVFSVADGVVLRPLPIREADRVVRLWSNRPERQLAFFSVSYPDFTEWKAQNRVFSDMAAYERQRDAVIRLADEPMSLELARVTPDVFHLLGTAAALGRPILPDDARADAAPVVVLSYWAWTNRFGSDSSIVGRRVNIDGRGVTIVGVMPRFFSVPGTPAAIWAPLSLADAPPDRGNRYLRVLARLRDGVSVDQAKSEMEAVTARLALAYPESNAGWTISIRSVPEQVVSPQFRGAVRALAVVVALVLLIACANAANLMLTRGASRRKELAVRMALGASRRRIATQLIVESLVLAAIAGALGVGLAQLGIIGLRSIGENVVPRLAEIRIDGTVLLFTSAVTVVSGILFGAIPSVRMSRSDVGEVLKEGGRAGQGGVRSFVRAGLVVAQISTSLVLLVGAGLMMRSFVQYQRIDTGFSERGLYFVSLRLPSSYPSPESRAAFFDALFARAKRIPGVRSAAMVSSPPFAGVNAGMAFARADLPVPQAKDAPGADYRVVTPNYFATIGTKILAGRDFDASDRVGATEVVIISDAMARRYWPGENPLGKRIRISDIAKGPEFTVVGIVPNIRYQDRDSTEVRPLMYFSMVAHPQQTASVMMRAAEAGPLTTGVREAVSTIDPSLPRPEVQSMETYVRLLTSTTRFAFSMFALFAAVSLLLAAIGIYGVLSYVVRLRGHELGVRVALGASKRSLVLGVMGGSMRLIAAGIVVGIVLATMLTKLMDGLLFRVQPHDVATFAAVVVVLALVGIVASLVPARRATRVDPLVALKADA